MTRESTKTYDFVIRHQVGAKGDSPLSPEHEGHVKDLSQVNLVPVKAKPYVPAKLPAPSVQTDL